MSFLEEIKRPFNLLMIAIALIPGFYFYYFPHNDRKIAYMAETPALIFDSRISTPALRLVDEKNVPIKSDTYLQTLTIWNNGAVPLEPNDVRRPMMVVFQGATRILDCKIVGAVDQDVNGFELSRISPTGAVIANAVEVKWKHFDPKKGVKFQVIFEQPSKPQVLLTGDIVGVSKFQSGIAQRDWKSVVGALCVIIPTGLFSLIVLRDGFRAKNSARLSAFVFGGFLLATVLFIVWRSACLSLLPTPPL